jgi:EAL domain-containing protein (putative c-di-GMP-specific phosphodiesterase class I)
VFYQPKVDIEMGHELGMKVAAEGVETAEQLQYLKNLQCDVAQGYYYSKPVSIMELIHWINHQYRRENA